jgi:hypothetical protein
MNILTVITTLYSALGPLLATPTGARIMAAASEILVAYITQKASVVIDGYTVSAANSGGAPVAFKISELGVAVEHIVAGETGSVTVGATVLSIMKNAA